MLLDKLSASFQISIDDVSNRESPRRPSSEIHFILKQLIDSHESGDFVLIADLLEYEILPLVPIWREMFKIISEKKQNAIAVFVKDLSNDDIQCQKSDRCTGNLQSRREKHPFGFALEPVYKWALDI